MVSSVWKVLVQPGAEVAAGEALVILESMKMEIPVLTERAGTVRELHVVEGEVLQDRKSTRLNSSHANISYAVFCLKKKIHISFSFISSSPSRTFTLFL